MEVTKDNINHLIHLISDDPSTFADNLNKLHRVISEYIAKNSEEPDIFNYIEHYCSLCFNSDFSSSSICEVGFTGLLNSLKLFFLITKSFPTEKYYNIIAFFFRIPENKYLIRLLCEACSIYSDLRYYTIKYILKVKNINLTSNIDFLTNLNISEIENSMNRFFVLKKDEDSNSKISDRKAHRVLFNNYINFVVSESPKFNDSDHRKILNYINSEVMCFMTRPSLLSDYFYSSFHRSFSIGVLSLNGLFYLMRRHNIECSNFYEKLLQLLVPDVFACSTQKTKLLKLLPIFMKSTHLSDAAFASILKRISNLSLGSSTHSLKWIIPFIYNGLKNKSRLRNMIHCSDNHADWNDKYQPKSDIEATNAEKSCLWELESLTKHYYFPISSSLKIFKERLVRPPYNLSKEFFASDENLIYLLHEELKHKWSKKPPTQLKYISAIF